MPQGESDGTCAKMQPPTAQQARWKRLVEHNRRDQCRMRRVYERATMGLGGTVR